MKKSQESSSARDSFGSGFNQNAIRHRGVAFSVAEHSVRTETPAVKAASEEAVQFLKATVERGDVPQDMLASKAK